MLLRAAFDDLVRLVDRRAASHESHHHLERFPELIGPCHQAWPPVLMSNVPLGTDYVVEFAFMWPEWWGADHFWIVQFGPPAYQIFQNHDDFTDEFQHECEYISRCADWAERNRAELPRLLDRLVEAGMIGWRPDRVTFLDTFLIIGRRSENHANHQRYERFHQRVRDATHAHYHIRSWDGFFEKWVQKPILDRLLATRIPCARYNEHGFDLIANAPLLPDDDAPPEHCVA